MYIYFFAADEYDFIDYQLKKEKKRTFFFIYCMDLDVLFHQKSQARLSLRSLYGLFQEAS